MKHRNRNVFQKDLQHPATMMGVDILLLTLSQFHEANLVLFFTNHQLIQTVTFSSPIDGGHLSP